MRRAARHRGVIAGILLAGGLAAPPLAGACAVPIHYAVGKVDPRFDLSRPAFEAAIRDAARLWEDAAGRELFVQRAGAGFRVNLVFSEHQRATERIQDLEADAGDLKGRIAAKQERLEVLRADFHQANRAYEKRLRAFEADRQALESRIRALNEAGGGSASQRQALAADRDALQERARDLEAEREHVRELQARVNRLAVAANALVIEHNKRVSERNELADPGGEVRQGYYQRGGAGGQQITVRQFNGTDRLRFVLAHELGHALGIRHVGDRRAVMHYLNEDGGSGRPGLTEADREALFEACGWER